MRMSSMNRQGGRTWLDAIYECAVGDELRVQAQGPRCQRIAVHCPFRA